MITVPVAVNLCTVMMLFFIKLVYFKRLHFRTESSRLYDGMLFGLSWVCGVAALIEILFSIMGSEDATLYDCFMSIFCFTVMQFSFSVWDYICCQVDFSLRYRGPSRGMRVIVYFLILLFSAERVEGGWLYDNVACTFTFGAVGALMAHCLIMLSKRRKDLPNRLYGSVWILSGLIGLSFTVYRVCGVGFASFACAIVMFLWLYDIEKPFESRDESSGLFSDRVIRSYIGSFKGEPCCLGMVFPSACGSFDFTNFVRKLNAHGIFCFKGIDPCYYLVCESKSWLREVMHDFIGAYDAGLVMCDGVTNENLSEVSSYLKHHIDMPDSIPEGVGFVNIKEWNE